MWYVLLIQCSLELSILFDSPVPLYLSGQNVLTKVEDLIVDLNDRYFRVLSFYADAPAPYGDGCRRERLRRKKSGMRVIGLRKEDGTTALHERQVIRGLARNYKLTLTVVLGSSPMLNKGPQPPGNREVGWGDARAGNDMRDRDMSYSVLSHEMQLGRQQSVLLHENNKYPLLVKYTSVERLRTLANIPETLEASLSLEHNLRNLADGVDSGDLGSTLASLRSLGPDPPRLTNVLVAAHSSTDTSSVQCVGADTYKHWSLESAEVLGEQRLYSLPGLAWRRRHYFVFHALQTFESYAKSGLLRYFFGEYDIRVREVMNVTALHHIPEGLVQIISGYMTPFFPHPLDMESIMIDDHGQAFGSRSKLVRGDVLSEEATNTILGDENANRALGGQWIPNGEAFKPYDDPTVHPTVSYSFTHSRANGHGRMLPF
jgi:hypothetical protein